MIKFSNHVYSLQKPSAPESLLPIVFDSPHSGMEYPFNSGIIAPAESLRLTWSAFINELWQEAPALGAPLLAARFPCAYIDPDCSPHDIDWRLVDDSWPTKLMEKDACHRSASGLIRANVRPGMPMYRSKLPLIEVQRRVKQYYEPYHQCLKELIDLAHSTFGQVWHINCHALKSDSFDKGRYEKSERGEADRYGWPQIIISDFNGGSSGGEFTEWVAGQFDALGYRTLIVAPYHGGYIVQNYGVPTQGRNSVQIAIRRSLYLDEKTFEKTENFSSVQHDLETFMTALSVYVQKKKAA